MYRHNNQINKDSTLFLLLSLLLLLSLGGCASTSKYIPSNHILKLNKSLTKEQAVFELNNNIYVPRDLPQYATSYKETDALTTIKALPDSFVLNNLWLRGKAIKREYNSTTYEKIRYNSKPIKYSNIIKIERRPHRAGKNFCKSGDNFFQIHSSFSKYFPLCVVNEEYFYASVLKLIPKVNLETVD